MAALLLEWLRQTATAPTATPTQQNLFAVSPYVEDAPAIRNDAEMAGAIEHLEYAVFRRERNQLTRSERARLENSIENALFKATRFLERLDASARTRWAATLDRLGQAYSEIRARDERLRHQARRLEARLAQLDRLSPEQFEEYVAELFESLGFQATAVGGTGDAGIDLRVERRGLIGVVQCKYHRQGVIGSPDLQRLLGSIHHARAHVGFFVTTRTFSLAAEKFAAEHPIELIDGPRLAELVHEALGTARRPRAINQPTLFQTDGDSDPCSRSDLARNEPASLAVDPMNGIDECPRLP
jgi:restriction system protein